MRCLKEGMNRSDLRLVMICAFRYSLGRRSYMPSSIVDLIIGNPEVFNNNDWDRFIEEIGDEDNLGNSCDVQTWNKLIEFSKKQLKKEVQNE
ncbi:MAG: hypothetical protein KKB31_05285 [Nanoarchaeota archaeon]|nr:hypothetical protein [Nanoarchaeota archaeon]